MLGICGDVMAHFSKYHLCGSIVKFILRVQSVENHYVNLLCTHDTVISLFIVFL